MATWNDVKQFENVIDIREFAADLYHAFVTNAAIRAGVDSRDLPHYHELAPSDHEFMQERARQVVQEIYNRR